VSPLFVVHDRDRASGTAVEAQRRGIERTGDHDHRSDIGVEGGIERVIDEAPSMKGREEFVDVPTEA